MKGSIERARLVDLSELLWLEKKCFASDRLSAYQYKKYLKAKNARIYCYRLKSQLVASALVLTRINCRIARLYSFAVAPDERGKGVSLALYKHIEADLQKARLDTLKLEVRKDNQVAAKFYMRLGFQIVGEYQHYYEDGEDAWRMLKNLD